MHDWKVLHQLTVGYLVANELKYHATCLVIGPMSMSFQD